MSFLTLNRLNGASNSTNGNPRPGFCWSYDAWGDRAAQTITSGCCGSWSASFSGSNQIANTGYAYDAAGNLTNDGTHWPTGTAEGAYRNKDWLPRGSTGEVMRAPRPLRAA